VLPNTWVDRELADRDFTDERIGECFRSLLGQFSASPGESIPMVDWANTKAACRFPDSDRVSEADILAGHFFEATHDRAAKAAGPIRVLHDTAKFSYRARGRASHLRRREAAASTGRRAIDDRLRRELAAH
jgi:hypothetical protein